MKKLNYYTELFHSGFITENVDMKNQVVLLPQHCTSICDFALVIDSEQFDSILKKARSDNPMNEALLVSLHDAVQNEEFSLYQIFINDKELMEIYKEKRKEYQHSSETISNPYFDLDNEEEDEKEEENEAYENYKENVETIMEELESRISNNTFLDLFLCDSEEENKANAKVLTDSIVNISNNLEADENKFIYSVLSNILFTGELDDKQILQLYRLLSNKCLEYREYDILNNLFSVFIEKLYPDE